VGESGLTHQAERHDAPCDTNIDACLFEFLRGLRRVVGQYLFSRVGELVFAAVGRLSERLNLFQLFAPEFVNIFVESQWSPFLTVR